MSERRMPMYWNASSLKRYLQEGAYIRVPNDDPLPARPEGIPSLKRRLKMAFDVFNGRADAVRWPDGNGGYQ